MDVPTISTDTLYVGGGALDAPHEFPTNYRKSVSSRAALRRGDLPVGSPIFASTAIAATPYQEIATGAAHPRNDSG